MRRTRGFSLLEVLVAVGILLILGALIVVPAYQRYAAARGAADAAATLAQDIALLEATAQAAGPGGGAQLLIVATSPLAYRGVQIVAQPGGTIAYMPVFERGFAHAALAEGAPVGPTQPLIFFQNGSADYRANGMWADRHQTLALSIVSDSGGRATDVQLQLFTGAVSLAQR